MIKVTSLKKAIVYRLIIPIIIFIILETALSYFVTLHYVEKTYDRWLLDSAHSLVQEVKVIDNKVSVLLSDTALEIFKWDDIDTTFFKINAEMQGFIVGDLMLPAPTTTIINGYPVYSNVNFDGNLIRMVSLQVPGTLPDKVFIHVAETLNKRQDMIVDILLADLIPQIVLTLLISLLIYEAINHGLAPLHKLADDISKRSPSDLSPISESDVFTEVKSLTDTINDLLRKLSTAIASQQRFIANAAHQLRTPLAGLKLQAERAQKEENVLAMKPALSQIQNSADRVSHLITQLLALARSGPIEGCQQFEIINLYELAKNVCIEWIPRALEKDIELSFDAVEQTCFVKGDRVLLTELLTNLLDNAITYGDKQGNIQVRLTNQPNLCLSIEDDGPGILDSEKDKIFERFYRVPGSLGNGCGLGLAIVKEIADLHQLKLLLLNSISGGTRIDVEFDEIGKTLNDY
ncbi:MAG: sensor histidine kinase N-terminal domain-containing protein [Methylococcaceae bacterium]|nr:sensor histidine kinase N-terminal domain-containing protein [Methylococcaceae bacterium]